MKDNKTFKKDFICFIIIGILLGVSICGLVYTIYTDLNPSISVYVVKDKKLSYYLSGTGSDITICADEDANYCYIINNKERSGKKSTEDIYKVDLTKSIVLVKKAKTLEII